MTPHSTDLIRDSGLPRHEAERLLTKAAGVSRIDVILGFDVPSDDVATFESLVARRSAGEPLQYIEGEVPFGPVTISVDHRVLVPRPETEQLFEIACGLVERPRRIVDLCTGSGNLATALAAAFPEAAVHATELSADAVEVARRNAHRNGRHVDVLVGDLFDPLPERLRGRIDLIVANPPYLSASELEDVPADVRREPVSALVAGDDGDEIVRRIAEASPDWLRPGGAVAVEISEVGADRSVGHFDELDGELHEDMFGKPRFVIGRRRFE